MVIHLALKLRKIIRIHIPFWQRTRGLLMTTTQPFDTHSAHRSFNVALRAQIKSPRTVELYSLADLHMTVS